MAMELAWRSYGEGEPLVILHGLLGSGENWHTLASRVFAKHFQVITADLRNHGRSPHDDRFDYPALAGDVVALLDDLSLPTAHLMGHSLGGKVAMYLALDQPPRVRRLVVVDTAPKAYPSRHEALIEAMVALDPGAFASRAEADAALAPEVPSAPLRAFLLKNLERRDEGGFRWRANLDAIRAGHEAINGWPRTWRRFRGPTLFLRGGASDYVSDGDLPAIRRLFPDAVMITVPSAGHWVHADAPQALCRAVLGFLGAASATG